MLAAASPPTCAPTSGFQRGLRQFLESLPACPHGARRFCRNLLEVSKASWWRGRLRNPLCMPGRCVRRRQPETVVPICSVLHRELWAQSLIEMRLVKTQVWNREAAKSDFDNRQIPQQWQKNHPQISNVHVCARDASRARDYVKLTGLVVVPLRMWSQRRRFLDAVSGRPHPLRFGTSSPFPQRVFPVAEGVSVSPDHLPPTSPTGTTLDLRKRTNSRQVRSFRHQATWNATPSMWGAPERPVQCRHRGAGSIASCMLPNDESPSATNRRASSACRANNSRSRTMTFAATGAPAAWHTLDTAFCTANPRLANNPHAHTLHDGGQWSQVGGHISSGSRERKTEPAEQDDTKEVG